MSIEREPITEKEKETVKEFVRIAFNRLLFIEGSPRIEETIPYDKLSTKSNIHKFTISVSIPYMREAGSVKENTESIIECMMDAYSECRQKVINEKKSLCHPTE